MARWWCRPCGADTRKGFEENTNTSFYQLAKPLQSTYQTCTNYVETAAIVFKTKFFRRQLFMISVAFSIVISIVIMMMMILRMINVIIIALIVLRCGAQGCIEATAQMWGTPW